MKSLNQIVLNKFYYENKCPSPDGTGILFLASLGRKRYRGQQETAPENTHILVI